MLRPAPSAVVHARSYAPCSWRAGFAPLEHEHDLVLDTRTEAPPTRLRGTLFRNGPGRNERFGVQNGHWFDGDGMVAAFRFDRGRVTFSNRYVRTPTRVAEEAAGKRLFPRLGTPVRGGVVRNNPLRQYNAANVHVVAHGRRLLALSDLGAPIALDPRTLETLGRESFDGSLPKLSVGGFGAHAKRDPATGFLVTLGMRIEPTMLKRMRYCVYEIPPDEPVLTRMEIACERPFWAHDFGLTTTRIVLPCHSAHFDVAGILATLSGRAPLLGCVKFRPEEPMRIYVADRCGREPTRCYVTDPGFLVHVANAFDDGDDVVLDAVLYADDSADRLVDAFYAGQSSHEDPGLLTRLRLGADGKVTREELSQAPVELPTINPDRVGRPYRYTYTVVVRPDAPMSSRIAKIDVRSGRAEYHDFGDGCFAAEPVFAQDPDDSAEDAGWLLSVVYDARVHRSFLGIVRANRLREHAVRVELPFHLPFGFHGSFTPHVF